MLSAVPEAVLHPPAPAKDARIVSPPLAKKSTQVPSKTPVKPLKDPLAQKEVKDPEYGEYKDFSKNKKKIVEEEAIKFKAEKKAEEEVYQSPNIHEVDGVNLKVYDFFDISITTNSDEDIKKMQVVSAWALKNRSLKAGIQKLRDVALKLGGASFGESKITAIYNYVKMRSR